MTDPADPPTPELDAEVELAVPPPADFAVDAGAEAPPEIPLDVHDAGPEWFEPGPSPAAEILAGVVGLGDRLGRRLDGLQSAFDREVRAEATREKVVDRLHAELQEAKQDVILGMMRPVFVDLIQLHDDIGKIVDAQDDPDRAFARLLDLMRGFQQGVEDILLRQGVEPFEVEGDAFDARRQRAIATVPTDDPNLARQVAARHRPGFRSGDRVIRPEVVSVYAHRP